jgi:PAS domain-containing protein
MTADEPCQPRDRGREDDDRPEAERVRELPARICVRDLGELLGLVAARELLRVDQVVGQEQRRRDDQGGGGQPGDGARVDRWNLPPQPRPRARLTVISRAPATRAAVYRWHVQAQKPIELILARNLMSSLSTPAFLVDEGGVIVFYNEAAGKLLGVRFEEFGRAGPDQWGTAFGPFDRDGNNIPYDKLPITLALREGRPVHDRFRIRSLDGADHEIEVSAMPIQTSTGSRGAIAYFWPAEGGDA